MFSAGIRGTIFQTSPFQLSKSLSIWWRGRNNPDYCSLAGEPASELTRARVHGYSAVATKKEVFNQTQFFNSSSVVNSELSFATSATSEFMCHWGVILTDLCWGDGKVQLDEWLWTFQSSHFDSEMFWNHLRCRKQLFWHLFEQKDVMLTCTEFSRQVVRFRALAISIQPFIYRKHLVSLLKRKYRWHQTNIALLPKVFSKQSFTSTF